MDYYYSSASNMSTRGRFSSRGGSSYRGSGRGDSSYRGSRGGGYSSSRGYSGSRGRGAYYPKYENSSSKYTSDGARYTTRMDDTSYRKPESSNYGSSRDHSHHRNDLDIGRKRIRSDSYSQNQGATGSRRSHEMEDYRGGGSRYSNSNSYTESRSYSENRGVFKKPRMSDYKPKDEYRGRKEISRSSVAISKLRSFRGRSIRGRTLLRRGGDNFLARKRAGVSASRTTSELLALRRSKMLKLRRMRERAKFRAEEKAVVEDKKKEVRAAEEAAEEKKHEGEKESEDKSPDEKRDKDKEKKEEGEICDGENDVKDKEKSKKSEERLDFFKKPFIKLQCPQCSIKCITFKEYIHHLYNPTHVKAMRERSEQLKQTLAKMRIAQRANQKKLDEEDITNMSTRSTFCPICKLNYSQEKSTHTSSDAHRKLKNILQPYCKVCRLPFRSPMIYERHICSLEHMQKKNALDERLGKSKGSSLEYLDNFMVLDSVGSGDEVEDSKDEKTEEESKKAEKKSDQDMNLGVEFVRKVEAFYCEVCRTFLPRISDTERVLRVHCRSKYHLRCYLKFGSDKLLEQIEGKEKKNGEEGKKSEQVDSTGKEHENHEGGGEDEGGMDEKLWADVSDILSQVEPETKSDDEDEEEGGRFDRFKSNEKKENGEVAPEENHAEKEKNSGAAEDINVTIKDEA